jgi:peptidoglycan/xylan/chitin deacetylase (PgdA/CDA1 family)
MELVYKCLALFNIHGFVRWFISKRKVTILLYHNPSFKKFECHIAYLSKRYHFISLNELVESIEKKDSSLLLPYSMIVTFDDGHMNNYALLPVFKKYKVRPTIYLCSRIVTFKRPYWWELTNSKVLSERLKRIPNKERLDFLNNSYGFKQYSENIDKRGSGLSMAEIIEMKPYVDFESHTQFHPIITTLTEEERENELLGSLQDIRKRINPKCSAIAYPNGDYSHSDIQYLSKIGYRSGRTVDIGWNDLNTNPFKLKIIGVSDNASIEKLKFQLTGIFGFMNNLKEGGGLSGKKKAIKV